jgi:hypothetical protein
MKTLGLRQNTSFLQNFVPIGQLVSVDLNFFFFFYIFDFFFFFTYLTNQILELPLATMLFDRFKENEVFLHRTINISFLHRLVPIGQVKFQQSI